VRWIELARRLVEQQHDRLLGEAAGDQHQLILAAAQGRDGPLGEPRDARGAQRVARDGEIRGLGDAERRQVRRAPEQDVVGHAEREAHVLTLRHEAHRPGLFPPAPRRQGPAAEHHRACVGSPPAEADVQQRGLARSIGAEHRRHRPGLHREADAVEHAAAAGEGDRDAARLQEVRGIRA